MNPLLPMRRYSTQSCSTCKSFNLQVIGEAVKHLPDAASASLPEVDWSGPARLRDFIAHHYFSIDASIVWDAATNHVPSILKAARLLLQRFENSQGD